jgi:hypothetical protein
MSLALNKCEYTPQFERCSKSKITKPLKLLRKRWHSVKTTIRTRHHPQPTVITTENILYRELPNVQYGREQAQSSNLYVRVPRTVTVITTGLTQIVRDVLIVFSTIFI